MRPPPVQLPPTAAAKLSELTLARDAALDAGRSANSRLQGLPRDADQRMRDRLASEQGKHADRHRQLAQLCSRINQWWCELRLPPSAVLEPVSADIKLKPGEMSIALGAARAEIKTLRERLGVVKSAPLPAAEQSAAVQEFVARKALMAR